MEQETGAEREQNEVVVVRHLKKSFGGNAVLKDINLSLAKGENLAILGKSGQGKSVTIKCIARLLQQDKGEISVLGKNISDLDEYELKQVRQMMGFLFQGGALYDSMTVRENLAFPLERVKGLSDDKEINDRIHAALEEVGLAETLDKMPSELSGGMRKRIALARAIILHPQIILYDEPTTGLDPITSREISMLILELQEKYKASSIIITHDMACAHITANRMLVMNDGTFIAEGSYEELARSDDKLVQSFFK